MITILQIKQTLADAGKPVKEAQIYRYIRKLGLYPRIRQRPQRFAPDTAQRILCHLGFTVAPAAPVETLHRLPAGPRYETVPLSGTGKLITAKQLRAAGKHNPKAK
ncbi:MAG: hypothetical protein WCS94_08245 [Verrucomicrobiota bacterium]